MSDSLLVYRKAEKKDAELCITIYNSAFYDDHIKYGECPAYGRSKEDMEKSIEDFPKIIAYRDGNAVGLISFKSEGEGKYYIGCLAVIKEYQGQGIGTSILKMFMDQYKDWTELTLVTPKDKDENVRFYTKRFGFEIVGEEDDGKVVVYNFLLKR